MESSYVLHGQAIVDVTPEPRQRIRAIPAGFQFVSDALHLDTTVTNAQPLRSFCPWTVNRHEE